MWLTALVLTTLLEDAASTPWWNNALYYRILVDSFKDMDGDGLGDLQGVTKQLSYVRALGADAVILSPISSRSMDCSKPGTMDFVDIDERYGNIEQFTTLIEKAKKLELKVLVTLPLQTISENSELFNFSAERKAGFENKVIWREGSTDEQPVNEIGIDNWTWHDDRKAYYASSSKEVLFNLCSEELVTMLSDVQCTWLRRRASGVLLQPDFPSNIDCGVQLIEKLVVAAMSCSRTTNMDAPVILVETSFGAEIGVKYYGESGLGANSVISYALAETKPAAGLALALHAAILYPPQDMNPTWITSISNKSRIASRHGSDMVDAITMLALTLPGATIIQQGDELGSVDTILEWAAISKCWPTQGVPSAAPFPWDDTPKASFTTGEPWLPLSPNYRYANAKTEYANDLSHFGIVRVASAMRNSSILGPHVEIKRIGDALAILRWGGSGSLLYISNLGRGQSEVQLSRIPGLPTEMTVAISSSGSSLSPGFHVNLDKVLKLSSGETAFLVGSPRHCGGPGPVDKIANKLSEGWQKINKYFSSL
ncbi:unnamed protein product, partial [Brenthis ino]